MCLLVDGFNLRIGENDVGSRHDIHFIHSLDCFLGNHIKETDGFYLRIEEFNTDGIFIID